MSNLFIDTMAKRQQKDLKNIQRIQEANKRQQQIKENTGYQWGLFNELKKDIAPTTNAVMDSETAHQEFMKVLERYGLGGESSIYSAWEEALGKDRYSDPYFKRTLTYALDKTLAKYVPYPPKDSE